MRIFNSIIYIVAAVLIAGCDSNSESGQNNNQILESNHQKQKAEKRYGSVIKVKAEKFEEYKKLHAAVWPHVLKKITECNIRNYSIYHKDGFLFSYFEYVGDDFEADMEKMAADKKTQEWWKITDPMQEPLDTRAEDEWWAGMEEVFHYD